MAVIGFMFGIIALATAANTARQVAALRQELEALRASLGGTRGGGAPPAPPAA